jgi:exonuclease III
VRNKLHRIMHGNGKFKVWQINVGGISGVTDTLKLVPKDVEIIAMSELKLNMQGVNILTRMAERSGFKVLLDMPRFDPKLNHGYGGVALLVRRHLSCRRAEFVHEDGVYAIAAWVAGVHFASLYAPPHAQCAASMARSALEEGRQDLSVRGV